MIFMYDDCVNNNSNAHKALIAYAGHEQIRLVDADDIKHGILDQGVKAFVMPGGASRFVADKLNGRGNALIRDYVEHGGLYVGICAGAYYACRRTEWRPRISAVFLIDNELGFYAGTAKGPIQDWTREDLDLPFTAAKVQLQTSDGQMIDTLYRGGPFLSGDAGAEVLARYHLLTGQPAAVVSGAVGQGRYLLTSAHIEIDTPQLERMNFNVVANDWRDISAMPDRSNLTRDYFFSLLDQYVA